MEKQSIACLRIVSIFLLNSNKYNSQKQKTLKKIKAFNITTEQWMIIKRLFEESGISQKELAERTLKDQASLTRTLDRMEKKAIIERQISPCDRRSFLIYLTDAGRDLRNLIIPIALECIDEAIKDFTAEEVKTLEHLLNKLTANLTSD